MHENDHLMTQEKNDPEITGYINKCLRDDVFLVKMAKTAQSVR
jgi:hypothetical protein